MAMTMSLWPCQPPRLSTRALRPACSTHRHKLGVERGCVEHTELRAVGNGLHETARPHRGLIRVPMQRTHHELLAVEPAQIHDLVVVADESPRTHNLPRPP